MDQYICVSSDYAEHDTLWHIHETIVATEKQYVCMYM